MTTRMYGCGKHAVIVVSVNLVTQILHLHDIDAYFWVAVGSEYAEVSFMRHVKIKRAFNVVRVNYHRAKVLASSQSEGIVRKPQRL